MLKQSYLANLKKEFRLPRKALAYVDSIAGQLYDRFPDEKTKIFECVRLACSVASRYKDTSEALRVLDKATETVLESDLDYKNLFSYLDYQESRSNGSSPNESDSSELVGSTDRLELRVRNFTDNSSPSGNVPERKYTNEHFSNFQYSGGHRY